MQFRPGLGGQGRHVNAVLNGIVDVESNDILTIPIFQESVRVISAFLSDSLEMRPDTGGFCDIDKKINAICSRRETIAPPLRFH